MLKTNFSEKFDMSFREPFFTDPFFAILCTISYQHNFYIWSTILSSVLKNQKKIVFLRSWLCSTGMIPIVVLIGAILLLIVAVNIIVLMVLKRI